MGNKRKIFWPVAVASLLGWLASSCQKDPIPTPQPNPNQPTDTITPIIPTKEITIHWNWDANIGWAPPKDSIKYYTDQDSVKFVTINLIGRDGVDFPINGSGWRPRVFHKARDTLQTRIDIEPSKVQLSGTIIVGNVNLPSHDTIQEPGITWYDRDWFEKYNCIILLAHHGK